MTISEHAIEFAGLPVRDYDPETGIEDSAGSIYRLSVDWDAKEPLTDLLARFLEDPRAGLVRGIIIGAWQGDDSGASSESIVEALVAARESIPNIRALFLGDIICEECEISWIQQSDVTPLFDAYPGLEHFRVRGGSGLFIGTLRHEKLRSLVVETGGLDSAVVKGIAASELIRLEHLELWLGSDGYGGNVALDDLETILQGDRFPALRRLGLRNCEWADALAEALAKAPVVTRLEVLDLSLGNLGDPGVLALAASPAIAGLKVLDIHHHYASDEAILKLNAIGVELDASDRKEPDDWGGEEHRYIAVSE